MTLPCDDGDTQCFQLTSQPIQSRPAAVILRPSDLVFVTLAHAQQFSIPVFKQRIAQLIKTAWAAHQLD